MSDEQRKPKDGGGERLDDEGLPLDREPTFNDVRGGEGSGATLAAGCAVLVAVALVLFWLLRGLLMG